MLPRSRLAGGQSKKYSERRKYRVLTLLSLGILCLVVWVFAIVRFSNLEVFTVRSMALEGVDADISESIKSAVTQAMQESYLGLISKGNVFLYSKAEIMKVVRNFPQVAAVSVKTSGLKSLEIKVTQKTPAAIVCTSFPNFNSTDENPTDCYYTDSSGFVFKSAPEFSANVFKKYYIPDITVSTTSQGILGSYATNTAKFLELQNFYTELRNSGIEVVAILIKPLGEYELYVRNPSRQATTTSDTDYAVVYFYDKRPFGEQLVNLVSFWKNMIDNARLKKEKLLFEYIDVRYGSNVFFRLIK